MDGTRRAEQRGQVRGERNAERDDQQTKDRTHDDTQTAHGYGPGPVVVALGLGYFGLGADPEEVEDPEKAESDTAPTPRAASDSAPSRLMKAVSTRPVSGSAMSESRTGKESRTSVAWGLVVKGWSDEVPAGFESRIFTWAAC